MLGIVPKALIDRLLYRCAFTVQPLGFVLIHRKMSSITFISSAEALFISRKM